MRVITKILAVVVLVCFGLNNISFASEINAFKLSPPSSFSNLKGLEFKEAAQIQIGIRTALKELQALNINALKSLGSRPFAERTVFTNKISGTIYFNDSKKFVVQGQKMSAARMYIVKAVTSSGKIYYSLISKASNGNGHDISVVSDRVLAEILQKDGLKFKPESVANSNDKDIIDLYTEHEVSTENNIAIDEWIRLRMERGEYAVDDLTGREDPLYQNPARNTFNRENLIDILSDISNYLETLGIKENNVQKILDSLLAKPFVLIPYESATDLPVLGKGNGEIIVTAHSSPFATYIFVPKWQYEHIVKQNTWSDIRVIDNIKYELIHEIGAICGLKSTVKDRRFLNILDEYFILKDVSKGEAEELKDLAPVNLLELELRNDYAAGTAVEKKSIFKRVMAAVVIVALAGGSYLYHKMMSGKTNDATTNAISASEDLTQRIVREAEAKRTNKNIAQLAMQIPRLKAEEWAVREGAVKYIGLMAICEEINTPGMRKLAIDAVEQLLKTEQRKSTRDYAEETLVILKQMVLLAEVSTSEDPTQRAISEAEARRTNKNIAYLAMQIPLLKSYGWTLREGAVRYIKDMTIKGEINTPGMRKVAIDVLEQLLKTEQQKSTRAYAEETLIILKATTINNSLVALASQITLLKADEWTRRERSIIEIKIMAIQGNINTPELKKLTIDALERLLKTEQRKSTRDYAEETLIILRQMTNSSSSTLPANGLQSTVAQAVMAGSIGQISESNDSIDSKLSERINRLVEKMGSEEKGDRSVAVDALIEIGKPAVPRIIEALRDSNEQIRIGSIVVLGTIVDARAIHPIGLALDDQSWEVRKIVAQALGLFKDEEVVSHLRYGMINEKIPVVKAVIADSMSRVKDKSFVSLLIASLKSDDYVDNDPDVRISVLFALGEIADKTTVPNLISMLGDKNEKISKAAAEALTKIGEPAIPSLIKVFGNANEKVRISAGDALVAIGKPAVQPLIKALNAEDFDTKIGAVIALGFIGDKETAAPLHKLLSDVDDDIRKLTVRALGRIKDQSSTPFLIRLLKDKNEQVVAFAAEALGNIGSQQAAQPLIALLKSGHKYGREEIVTALASIGGEQAIEIFIGLIKDGNSRIRFQAVYGLAQSRDKRVIKPLIEALKDESAKIREIAIRALGSADDVRAVRPLIDALVDRDWLNRDVVANALCNIGRPALPFLIEALKDENEGIRYYVVIILGKIGSEETLKPLKGALKDRSEDVREEAKKAIEKIQNIEKKEDRKTIIVENMPMSAEETALLKQIRSLLESCDSKDEKSRLIAIKDLISIGKPAVSHLIVIFKDNNANIAHRIHAGIALGGMRDERIMPVLLGMLKDTDWRIRLMTVSILGALDRDETIEPLTELLTDENSAVRKAAKDAIEKIQKSQELQSPVKPTTSEPKGDSMLPANGLQGTVAQAIMAASMGSVNVSTTTSAPAQDELTKEIEGLIAQLHSSETPECCKAIYRLGKIKDKRAVDALIEGMKNQYWQAPGVAASVLAETKDPRAFDELIKAIAYKSNWYTHGGGSLHQGIARGFAILGDKRAIGPLSRMVSDEKEDGFTRTSAAYALAALNATDATPYLLQALKSKDYYSTRPHVAKALKEMGWEPQTIEETVLYLIADNDWDGLAGIGQPAIPYIIDALQAEDWLGQPYQRARRNAERALRKIGKPAFSLLVENLKSRIAGERAAAARMLGLLGYEEALQVLAETMNDQDMAVCKEAAKAIKRIQLRRLGKEEIKTGFTGRNIGDVAEKVKSENYDDRIKAIETLGLIGDSKALPILCDILNNSKNPGDRQAAAESLGLIGGKKATVALLEKLKGDDFGYVRAAAAESLELIGDRDAIKPIIAAIKKGDWNDFPAMETLRSLADSRDIQIIVNALLDSNNIFTAEDFAEILIKIGEPSYQPILSILNTPGYDPYYRAAAAWALGEFKDARAVAPLTKVLTNEHPVLIGIAAEALGKIGAPAKSALTELRKLSNNQDKFVRESAEKAIRRIQAALYLLQLIPKYEKEPLPQVPAPSTKVMPSHIKSTMDGIGMSIPAVAVMNVTAPERVDQITEVLWKAGLGAMSKAEASAELAKLTPEVGRNEKERNAIYERWIAMAASTMIAMSIKWPAKYEKPSDDNITSVASRIKEAGVEIFIRKSQFPGDTVSKYRGVMESIGGKLRIYQNVEDLQSMITNPEKSIVMAVDVSDEDARVLETLKAKMEELRFMSFAKMDDLSEMTPEELDNYEAEMLGILLVARIITAEDFQDRGNPTYRLLSHLLEDYMPDGVSVDGYIEDIVNNAARLVKTILKALPIAVYKVMRQSVEVLWSA